MVMSVSVNHLKICIDKAAAVQMQGRRNESDKLLYFQNCCLKALDLGWLNFINPTEDHFSEPSFRDGITAKWLMLPRTGWLKQ